MAYRKTIEEPVTTQTTLANAKKWLGIIRYGESGSVIQFQDDCEYRVADVISNPEILKRYLGPYYRKFLLIYVPIDQKDVNSAIKDGLRELCEERKIETKTDIFNKSLIQILEFLGDKGFEIGLFISRINSFFDDSNKLKQFYELEYLLEKSRNLSIILFSEKDLSNPKYKTLTDKCSLLFDYLTIYPQYREKDSKQFIKYNNDLWKLKIKPVDETEIVKLCGGYLWLIMSVQRHLRDTGKLNIDELSRDSLLVRRLENIWDKFSDEEKTILKKTVLGNITDEDKNSHEYGYLVNAGFIRKTEKDPVLNIPLLAIIIDRNKQINNLRLHQGMIYCKSENFSKDLTPSENRLLITLISNRKKLLNRDIAAQSIWRNKWEEKGSDWAIDMLICRLRKKLHKAGIDPSLIKTVKKKGFIYG